MIGPCRLCGARGFCLWHYDELTEQFVDPETGEKLTGEKLDRAVRLVERQLSALRAAQEAGR